MNKKNSITLSLGILCILIGIASMGYSRELPYMLFAIILFIGSVGFIFFYADSKEKDRINESKEMVKGLTETLEQIMDKSDNSKLEEDLCRGISDIKKILSKNQECASKERENALNDFTDLIIRNRENIEGIVCKQNDTFVKIYTILKNMQELNCKEAEKQSDDFNKVMLNCRLIQEMLSSINDNIKNIDKKIESLNHATDYIAGSTEEIITKIGTTMDKEEKNIEGLTKSVNQQYEQLTKGISRKMEELLDEVGEYESQLKEKMEMLIKQYQQFEKYNDAVIRQLTMMSETDMEMLKGFLDGK